MSRDLNFGKNSNISMKVACACYVSWNDWKWLERTAHTPTLFHRPQTITHKLWTCKNDFTQFCVKLTIVGGMSKMFLLYFFEKFGQLKMFVPFWNIKTDWLTNTLLRINSKRVQLPPPPPGVSKISVKCSIFRTYLFG